MGTVARRSCRKLRAAAERPDKGVEKSQQGQGTACQGRSESASGTTDGAPAAERPGRHVPWPLTTGGVCPTGTQAGRRKVHSVYFMFWLAADFFKLLF